MITQEIEYLDGSTKLKGFIATLDDKNPQPGVLVAPAWSGRDDFACQKAKELAELGFVGFALDMYGDAKVGTNNDENAALMDPFMKNRNLLVRRMSAAFETLKSHDFVDPQLTAAIGFCFGGLCVLDLARSGCQINGVVSFHGLLGAPENIANKNITSKVLALHGYDDPMATPDALMNFAKEMTSAGADWQIHAYGNTMHAFTNPNANDKSFGTVYNEAADRRSWAAMTNFLDEIF